MAVVSELRRKYERQLEQIRSGKFAQHSTILNELESCERLKPIENKILCPFHRVDLAFRDLITYLNKFLNVKIDHFSIS